MAALHKLLEEILGNSSDLFKQPWTLSFSHVATPGRSTVSLTVRSAFCMIFKEIAVTPHGEGMIV